MRHAPFAAAFLAVLLVGAPAASAQNLLSNPGFEAGTLDRWTVGGPTASSVFASAAGVPIPGISATFTPGASLVHSGAFSASGVFRGTPPEGFTLSQTLSLTAGTAYTIGFSFVNAGAADWGLTLGTGAANATTILVNGRPVLPDLPFRVMPPGEWLDVTTSFVADGGPSVVTFQFVGSGTASAPASADDFYVFSAVPEPSVFWLTASGVLSLLGVAIARRRGPRS